MATASPSAPGAGMASGTGWSLVPLCGSWGTRGHSLSRHGTKQLLAVFQELLQTSEPFNVCIMQYTASFKPLGISPARGHFASLPLWLWICCTSSQQPLAPLCFGFALETSGLILIHTHRVLFSDLFHCPSLGQLIQPALLGNFSLPPKYI